MFSKTKMAAKCLIKNDTLERITDSSSKKVNILFDLAKKILLISRSDYRIFEATVIFLCLILVKMQIFIKIMIFLIRKIGILLLFVAAIQ